MSRQRILIVDDEADVVELIQRALESEDFEVLCAYDGIAALDIVDREKPDLILLDIMMPMMSGYEVCEQIKANPDTQHIPILCVTSAHGSDVRANTQRAGAQGLLVKPFIPAELVAQIRRHLSERSSSSEPRGQN